MMKPRFNFTPLAGILLVAWSMPSFAMRLGTPHALSYVGEKLILEVPLLDSVPDELKSVVIKSVAYPYAPRFAGHPDYHVELRVSSATPVLIITSDTLVNESVLDLAMSINWAAGNMIQPVTAILDLKPPVTTLSNASIEPSIQKVTPPVLIETPITSHIQKNEIDLIDTQIVKSSPAQNQVSSTYSIQPGDTLYTVASKTKPLNRTVAEWMSDIYSYNKVLRTSDISTISVLKLPIEIKVSSNRITRNISRTEKIEQSSHKPEKVKSVRTPQYKTVMAPSILRSIPPQVDVKTNNLNKTTDALEQTTKTVHELELRVADLLNKSKALDAEISKYQKKTPVNKPSSNITKQKGASLMPLFEDKSKGLLAVINAYSNLRNHT